MPGPLIVVDSREGSQIVHALTDLDARVVVRSLPAGDYAVGTGVLVERKTVHDLHLSLVQGRFWRQLGRLRGASRRRYLLIEGLDLDDGPLSPSAIRGACVSVTAQSVAVLWSRDLDDSASWLCRLAARWSRPERPSDRPQYDQMPAVSTDAAEAVLAAVPGISIRFARDLLDEFGSVAEVIEAGPDGWSKIRGIGAARIAALETALTHPRASRLKGEKVGKPLRPVAQHTVVTSQPGGTRVACSSQAEPRHLGGNP